MKKIKLNFQQFGEVEVLTRNQLKKILGGVALASSDPVDWTCGYACSESSDCTGNLCTYCENGSTTSFCSAPPR